MKKLFSKKSGFTLVEIVIALAIFAIMASMIAQMLNLAVKRRKSNGEFEKNLQNQEETLITVGKNHTYDESHGKDGTLSLKFKDKDGKNMPMNLDYQLKSADGTIGDKNGVNYFVGNMTYDGENGEIVYIPDDPGENPDDPSDIGGGSQMSRFDTRITGTKGINSISVSYTYDEAADEYTVSVTVNDSGVDASIKSHSQVTLFFGEGTSGVKLATVKEVNGGNKSQNYLKYVKPCGLNGVNIHCNGDGFGGSTVSFKVKFNEKINNLGFGSGDNISGNTYTLYTDSKGKQYPNIYGAYEKATATPDPAAPAT